MFFIENTFFFLSGCIWCLFCSLVLRGKGFCFLAVNEELSELWVDIHTNSGKDFFLSSALICPSKLLGTLILKNIFSSVFVGCLKNRKTLRVHFSIICPSHFCHNCVSLWTIHLRVVTLIPCDQENGTIQGIFYRTLSCLFAHLIKFCFIGVLRHFQHYFSYSTATVHLFMLPG